MWAYVLLFIRTPWELVIKTPWELVIPYGVGFRGFTTNIVFFPLHFFGYCQTMWAYVLLFIRTPWELVNTTHWELVIPFGVILFRVIPFGVSLTNRMSVSHSVGETTFSVTLTTSCPGSRWGSIPQVPMYHLRNGTIPCTPRSRSWRARNPVSTQFQSLKRRP